MLLQKPYELLTEFYKTHLTSYNCCLYINTMGRLQPLDGGWQLIRSEQEKAIKLFEYQKEMQKFADFLQNYFIHN